MSRIAMDWGTSEVVVACPMGPEQPPAAILPSDTHRLSNVLVFPTGRDGLPALGWIKGDPSPLPPLARVEDVLGVGVSGLCPERVWVRPGGPARLEPATDREPFDGLRALSERSESKRPAVLVIGQDRWDAAAVVSTYLRLLRKALLTNILNTPRFLAVLDSEPREVVCALPSFVPRPALKALTQAFIEAGFHTVTFVRRSAAAAAWRLRREQVIDPSGTPTPRTPTVPRGSGGADGPDSIGRGRCLVLDWTDEGLWVSVSCPSEAGFETPAPPVLAALKAVGKPDIRRHAVSQLCTSRRFRLVTENAPPEGRKDDDIPQTTMDQVVEAADDIVDQVFCGQTVVKTCLRCADNRPLEVRYGLSYPGQDDEETPTPDLSIEWGEEDIRRLLETPLRRLRNGLTALRKRCADPLPEVVCRVGAGFSVPGAADVVTAALEDYLSEPSAEDALLVSAKGALLLPRLPRTPGGLPYDCGVVYWSEENAPLRGTLVVSRGHVVPCECSSSVLEFSWQPGRPLRVSIYLRKVDFGLGTVAYTTHGSFDLIPGTSDGGCARLRADVRIDKDCRIDVTVADLVTGTDLSLEQMGILGGRPLASSPRREHDEFNGGLSRRLFEDYRRDHKEKGLDSVSEAEFRTYLDRVMLGKAQTEKTDLRAMAREVLRVRPPKLMSDMAVAENPALENAIKDETTGEDDIRQMCRTHLSSLLMGLDLPGILTPRWQGGTSKLLYEIRQMMSQAGEHDPPLSASEIQNIANKSSELINRFEVNDGYPPIRKEVEEVKDFIHKVASLYARLA